MVLNYNQNHYERPAKGSFVFWLGFFAALVGLDQLTKYLAFVGSFGNFLNAFKPAIKKFHYFNRAFAFSLPLPVALIYFLYAVILSAIVWYVYRNHRQFSRPAKIAWALILAGGISNIVERVALGYVRDFVYILSGIFNLADGYIIAGVIILLFASPKKNVFVDSTKSSK
jgi:signal peptidase II